VRDGHAEQVRVVSPPGRPQSTATASQVRRAWLRYLEATREAAPYEYERLEHRAWQRLTSNLAALGAAVPETGDSEDDSLD